MHVKTQPFVSGTTSSSSTNFETRKKVMCRWCNHCLSKRHFKAINPAEFTAAFSDGILLANLSEIVTQKRIAGRWNLEPKNSKEKLENIQKTIDHIFDLVDIECEANLIHTNNEDAVMGFMWTLIQAYELGLPNITVQETKTEILEWFNEIALCSDGLGTKRITDLVESWKSRDSLSNLVNLVVPDTLPPSHKTDQPSDRIKAAIDIAKEKFGVPKLIDPDDILENPDELANLTYISMFKKVLDQNIPRRTPPRRMAKIDPRRSIGRDASRGTVLVPTKFSSTELKTTKLNASAKEALLPNPSLGEKNILSILPHSMSAGNSLSSPSKRAILMNVSDTSLRSETSPRMRVIGQDIPGGNTNLTARVKFDESIIDAPKRTIHGNSGYSTNSTSGGSTPRSSDGGAASSSVERDTMKPPELRIRGVESPRGIDGQNTEANKGQSTSLSPRSAAKRAEIVGMHRGNHVQISDNLVNTTGRKRAQSNVQLRVSPKEAVKDDDEISLVTLENRRNYRRSRSDIKLLYSPKEGIQDDTSELSLGGWNQTTPNFHAKSSVQLLKSAQERMAFRNAALATTPAQAPKLNSALSPSIHKTLVPAKIPTLNTKVNVEFTPTPITNLLGATPNTPTAAPSHTTAIERAPSPRTTLHGAVNESVSMFPTPTDTPHSSRTPTGTPQPARTPNDTPPPSTSSSTPSSPRTKKIGTRRKHSQSQGPPPSQSKISPTLWATEDEKRLERLLVESNMFSEKIRTLERERDANSRGKNNSYFEATIAGLQTWLVNVQGQIRVLEEQRAISEQSPRPSHTDSKRKSTKRLLNQTELPLKSPDKHGTKRSHSKNSGETSPRIKRHNDPTSTSSSSSASSPRKRPSSKSSDGTRKRLHRTVTEDHNSSRSSVVPKYHSFSRDYSEDRRGESSPYGSKFGLNHRSANALSSGRSSGSPSPTKLTGRSRTQPRHNAPSPNDRLFPSRSGMQELRNSTTQPVNKIRSHRVQRSDPDLDAQFKSKSFHSGIGRTNQHKT